jgi:hypothetical protein
MQANLEPVWKNLNSLGWSVGKDQIPGPFREPGGIT